MSFLKKFGKKKDEEEDFHDLESSDSDDAEENSESGEELDAKEQAAIAQHQQSLKDEQTGEAALDSDEIGDNESNNQGLESDVVDNQTNAGEDKSIEKKKSTVKTKKTTAKKSLHEFLDEKDGNINEELQMADETANQQKEQKKIKSNKSSKEESQIADDKEDQKVEDQKQNVSNVTENAQRDLTTPEEKLSKDVTKNAQNEQRDLTIQKEKLSKDVAKNAQNEDKAKDYNNATEEALDKNEDSTADILNDKQENIDKNEDLSNEVDEDFSTEPEKKSLTSFFKKKSVKKEIPSERKKSTTKLKEEEKQDSTEENEQNILQTPKIPLTKKIFGKKYHLLAVAHENICNFYVLNGKHEVVLKTFLNKESDFDSVTNDLSEFLLSDCEIVICTSNVKFQLITTPPLNPFSKTQFLSEKLEAEMENYPIKSALFNQKNPNKTLRYLLIGINISEFIIDAIQFIDDSLDLYIKNFLLLNSELLNLLPQIKKKIDAIDNWDQMHKILIFEYSKNEAIVVITQGDKFIFSRQINYAVFDDYGRNAEHLNQEINSLINYVVRNYELNIDDFLQFVFYSQKEQQSNLLNTLQEGDFFQDMEKFSLTDLQISENQDLFTDNLLLEKKLSKHKIIFSTHKIANANKFNLLCKICKFSLIASVVVFLLTMGFNFFYGWQLSGQKQEISKKIDIKDAEYQLLMEKMGYEASEIQNIQEINKIYTKLINKKSCSSADQILNTVKNDFFPFVLRSMKVSSQDEYKEEVNMQLMLKKNMQEFFKILKAISRIEESIKKNHEVREVKFVGLPEQYSLSAIYSEINLQVSFVQNKCYEN